MPFETADTQLCTLKTKRQAKRIRNTMVADIFILYSITECVMNTAGFYWWGEGKNSNTEYMSTC